jgi:hypothetical protein
MNKAFSHSRRMRARGGGLDFYVALRNIPSLPRGGM